MRGWDKYDTLVAAIILGALVAFLWVIVVLVSQPIGVYE